MHFSFLSLCLFFLFSSFPLLDSFAFTQKLESLQILHTNDLHSYFEHTDHDSKIGGHARLKSLLEQEKNKAETEQIPTLQLDAGDFTEGHIFYLSQKGYAPFVLMNNLNFSAITLGNHDYLMGGSTLAHMLEQSEKNGIKNFPLLAANLSYRNTQGGNLLKKHIQPYASFTYGSKKVAVLGLTTNEWVYNWRLADAASVGNPYLAGRSWARWLKKVKKYDTVIALTHLGLKRDRLLAHLAPDIDLIVGGHGHELLSKPDYITPFFNKEKIIPIVQTGYHGKFYGKILWNLSENKLSSYSLQSVQTETPSPDTLELVSKAKEDLYTLYSKEWLEQIIGFSNLMPRQPYKFRPLWGSFIAQGFLEASQADFAIHAEKISGNSYPIGNISRWDLINNFPRFFELERKEGLNLYTVKIRGAWIKSLLKICALLGVDLHIAGLQFQYTVHKGQISFENLFLNQKPIYNFQYYTVALSEAIVRGAQEISRITSWILSDYKKLPVTIFSLLEKQFSKGPLSYSSFIHSLKEEDHSFPMVLPMASSSLDSVFYKNEFEELNKLQQEKEKIFGLETELEKQENKQFYKQLDQLKDFFLQSQ